ncbi:MAG TPA: GspH/FimT family pseudopilin [Burkholderiales bacterium]|nr:GspH/FimT family pseudopilin [Burkholderiales bacterium]
MSGSTQRGVTLIELMITLVVLSILISAALPSFSAWIANTQIRNGAEAVLNGLQFARSEAVRLNTNIEFGMQGASGTAWVVTDPAANTELQRRQEEGSSNLNAVATPPGATKVTFNGMGWVTTNADASARITQFDVSSATATSGTRPLRVVVAPGGSIKMCDPAVVAPDPRACP